MEQEIHHLRSSWLLDVSHLGVHLDQCAVERELINFRHALSVFVFIFGVCLISASNRLFCSTIAHHLVTQYSDSIQYSKSNSCIAPISDKTTEPERRSFVEEESEANSRTVVYFRDKVDRINCFCWCRPLSLIAGNYCKTSTNVLILWGHPSHRELATIHSNTATVDHGRERWSFATNGNCIDSEEVLSQCTW